MLRLMNFKLVDLDQCRLETVLRRSSQYLAIAALVSRRASIIVPTSSRAVMKSSAKKPDATDIGNQSSWFSAKSLVREG